MERKDIVAFIVLSLLAALYYAAPSNPFDSKPDLSADLAWCERIYHRNVGCPKYGMVGVPAEVLAREEAEDRDWCESIDYKNPTCTIFKEEVEREHCQSIDYQDPSCKKYEEEASLFAWCERIYHRNVSCPKYGMVEVPAEVLAREEAEDRCRSIDYQSRSCKRFREAF